MKQTTFILLLFCVIGLLSCRKSKIEPDIKQYDQQQILNYIQKQGITGMVRDTVGGDTTGIYYQILTPGTGARLTYPNQISMVYTVQTFDGTYTSLDTINNHFYDYLGHISTDNLPLGLQTAIINDLKYSGGRMRVLIPSHLAYGVNGTGSGSTQVANSRIGGNECLDYYVNIVDNQATYDDLSIQKYMAANAMTGYTKITDNADAYGTYYKVLTAPTSNDFITFNSTLTYYNTGQMINGVIFSDQNATVGTADVNTLVAGVQTAMIESQSSVGSKISILVPSKAGYATTSTTAANQYGQSVTVPANSVLRFTFVIASVTP